MLAPAGRPMSPASRSNVKSPAVMTLAALTAVGEKRTRSLGPMDCGAPAMVNCTVAAKLMTIGAHWAQGRLAGGMLPSIWKASMIVPSGSPARAAPSK